MKRFTPIVVLALFAIFVSTEAFAQKRARTMTPSATAPAPTPDPATPPASTDKPAPAATVAPLTITTTALPALEVGRKYDLAELINVNGGKPYESEGSKYYIIDLAGATEELKTALGYECGDCHAADLTPETEGSYTINVTVSDANNPALKATKAFNVKVGPIVRTPAEAYAKAEEALGAANRANNKASAIEVPSAETTTQLVLSMLIDTNDDGRGDTSLSQIVTYYKQQQLQQQAQKESRMDLASIAVYGLVGLSLLAIVVLVIRRRNAAAAAAILLVSLLGSGSAFAQGNTSPNTPTVKSFSPRYIVAGTKNVTFTIQGTNLDQLADLKGGVDTIVVTTKKDAAGNDVANLRLNAAKTILTGTVSVSEDQQGVYTGLKALKADGSEYADDVTEKIAFTVIDSDLAAFVRATAGAPNQRLVTLEKEVQTMKTTQAAFATKAEVATAMDATKKVADQVIEAMKAAFAAIDGVRGETRTATARFEGDMELVMTRLDEIPATVDVRVPKRGPLGALFVTTTKTVEVAPETDAAGKISVRLAELTSARVQRETQRRANGGQ